MKRSRRYRSEFQFISIQFTSVTERRPWLPRLIIESLAPLPVVSSYLNSSPTNLHFSRFLSLLVLPFNSGRRNWAQRRQCSMSQQKKILLTLSETIFFRFLGLISRLFYVTIETVGFLQKCLILF